MEPPPSILMRLISSSRASDFIVLEGNATVEKDGNQLRGEKILIDTETGKVKVEGNVEINIMAIEGEETN
jgi:lipopolysaccharide export system protein LptA